MEAIEGIPLKVLLSECRGQSRLIDLPHEHLLYEHDWSRGQDVHPLPCVIRGCANICTYMHPVCNQHAKQYWHVDLKKSSIPKAGRGVFIYKSVQEGTHLMDYTGIIRNADEIQAEYEAANASSCYKITIDDEMAQDSRSTTGGLGRYINHCSNPKLVNVCFELDEENDLFRIVATKNIRVPANGEVELLIDYGSNYWHENKPRSPSGTQLQQLRKELMLRKMRGEQVYEEYILPDHWPVFPSYRAVYYNPSLVKCPRIGMKSLMEMCRKNRVLLPVTNPKLMDPKHFDLSQPQTTIPMHCIVKRCMRLCQVAHPLCDQHLADFGFIVAKSTIPQAGNGLFITKSVPAGVTLMTFSGCHRNKHEVYDLYNRANADYFYVFEAADHFCIDARSSLGGIARLINHSSDSEQVNVELVSPANDPTFFIRTTRRILVRRSSRVELFLDYGSQYWKAGRVCRESRPLAKETPATSEAEAEPVEVKFACVPAYESIR